LIVIDTSALVAYLRSEPKGPLVLDAIEQAAVRHMSAFNVFEARVVFGLRFGAHALGGLELLLSRTQMVVVPFDADQALLAYRTYQKLGKGTGHPAQLNMGDCAAYALATSMDLPLLYVGEDFAKTDITSAL
jgi:ribonuclease VapC